MINDRRLYFSNSLQLCGSERSMIKDRRPRTGGTDQWPNDCDDRPRGEKTTTHHRPALMREIFKSGQSDLPACPLSQQEQRRSCEDTVEMLLSYRIQPDSTSLTSGLSILVSFCLRVYIIYISCPSLISLRILRPRGLQPRNEGDYCWYCIS
jgi:hypothetical protein